MPQPTPRAAPRPTVLPTQPSRMTLDGIKRGPLVRPHRILLHGVEKIGKSSFAAAAPGAIFVCPEDGTAQLDVARFPEPQTWSEILDCIEVLRREPHEYQHAVFDTLDWMEPLLWQHICARDGQVSVESYGYGKGYTAALDEWRIFVARLERLRAERGMHTILLAHSWIRPFKNPEGDDYDRYEMKLDRKAGGFLREWCDAVLFANYETYVHEDKHKRVRGVSTGARLLYTERSAAWDAGNRYNLPPQLPLDWTAFAEALTADRPAEPATIRARITEMCAEAAPAISEKAVAAMAKAGDNAHELVRIMNKLAGMLATQEGAR